MVGTAVMAVAGLAACPVLARATKDDRKAVAESYLKSLDAGGV